MVEAFLSRESKFQARRRKLKSRGVVLEEPKAMSIKATSVISDARLERLRKYLENEVTTTMIASSHEYNFDFRNGSKQYL